MKRGWLVASEFLLEIGCEEIPARAMRRALDDLKQRFETLLDEEKLAHAGVETLGSARRLVVRVVGLAEGQETRTETKLGPPKAIAFQEGKPSKALEGFARKSGVAVDTLDVIETERGEYMGFEARIEGKTASEVLTAGIPAVVGSLTFPKMMYWTHDRQRFARPIRWVLALLGGSTVPLELFGVGSGSATDGHRILGRRSIAVDSFDDYVRKLENNFVLVSEKSRKQKVEAELTEAASRLDARLVSDQRLLEEVVYINEYPTVIVGRFEERFLEVPREVLISVMREHQKYFALETSEGSLLPYFLAVMNTNEDRRGLIRVGHERVLRARLSDALFFWEVDAKQTLEQRTAGLKSIVFQKELGTYAEKVDRMRALAGPVRQLTGSVVPSDVLDTALRWAKSDLTTDLVGEFPGLQGVVGGLYARREGAPEELWRAIYDQYKPQSLEDRSPDTPTGVVVSLTDSLDTVIGCFSVGLIPTGSADPLGLRRQTQGIIKTLLDHGLPFSLEGVLASDSRLEGERANAVRAFWEDRLRYILGRRGFAYDEISAVLATSSDSPSDVLARVEALHDVRQSPDLVAIATAFKRIKNILKQSEKRGQAILGDVEGDDLEPAEEVLASALRNLEPQVAAWTREGEYGKILEQMADLRAPVDEFFDKIMVMHEDASVRMRRLVLLKNLFETFLQVADISEVVVSG